jgi:CBS domain containing-hemolysin-like protein
VTDEYGSTAGMVTIEDLLEELVGDIADEYDHEEPELEKIDENHYRVSGRMPIEDLNQLMQVEMPHEEWTTVAGLVYGLLGAVPGQGAMVTYDNILFVVEKVQGRRITKVLVGREDQPSRPL